MASRSATAAKMPRPEQVMAPLASVREPVVSWDSTSTVSKWKLGEQAWPFPDENTEGLDLQTSKFEVCGTATPEHCTARPGTCRACVFFGFV